MAEGTFLTQRELELQAGRTRLKAIAEAAGPQAGKDLTRHLKDNERQLKEDLEQRDRILTSPGTADNLLRDRSGAEIVDQAQTQLEALGHLADREERILTLDQQLAMERFEGPVDPEEAEAMSADAVTAQAVNQPTVLANNAGIPTEDRALNKTGLPVAQSEVPSERHVPKTRQRAEKIAKGKVPPIQKAVRPGWHGDKNGPTDVTAEFADNAIEVVEAADPVALSPYDTDIDHLLS